MCVVCLAFMQHMQPGPKYRPYIQGEVKICLIPAIHRLHPQAWLSQQLKSTFSFRVQKYSQNLMQS